MKKTLFIAVLSLVFSMVSAQNKVDFEIADGISDAALKTASIKLMSFWL